MLSILTVILLHPSPHSWPQSRQAHFTWGSMLLISLLSILGTSLGVNPALAQADVNEAATTTQPQTNLFDGPGLTVHDLMRAAEALNAKPVTPKDQEQALDEAIQRYRQSRNGLQLGPSTIQSDSETSAVSDPLDPSGSSATAETSDSPPPNVNEDPATLSSPETPESSISPAAEETEDPALDFELDPLSDQPTP